MEDPRLPEPQGAPPLQGPHWNNLPRLEDTQDVEPLKLILEPSGLAVELNRRETVVGRHTEADLRLPLPDVSRKHCRFVFCEHQWHIIDLNSLNGVFVNSERVQDAVLHHHDHIRIGGFTFLIDLHEPNCTLPMPINNAERVLQSIVDALEPPPPSRQAS